MSRTARFAALCAGALTTTTVTASAESGHHVGASAEASINWDTAPTSITDSINWD